VIQSVIAKAWDAIKEAVLMVMEAIQSAIVNAWETIKECVSNAVEGIKDVVIQVWTSLKGSVEAVMEALKQGIINSWNGVKETVASVVEAVRSAVVNVFSKLAEGVSGAMKNVLSVVKGGFTMVKEHIFGIAKEAFEWGKDFIMGIVNGIKSCIGKIKDAVTNVADTIKSFLHFSVPDVGPLTDYETWMPDFMSGLANGIENSRGMVAAAMKHVAKDMVLSPTISASTMQSSMSGTLQSNASIATKLDAMTQLMGRYLPKMAGSQIVLDSGVLVGELTDGINRQLGKGYI
jgi:phage-related protein